MRFLLVASLLLCACATTHWTDDALVAGLRSRNHHARGAAANQIRRHDAPPEVAPWLGWAASREPERAVLAKMLLALGRSGRDEDLWILQTHALSPDSALRVAARSGLHDWLVERELLAPDEELPEPPHRFYEEALVEGNDGPAPRLDGIPPGYHRTTSGSPRSRAYRRCAAIRACRPGGAALTWTLD